MLPHISWEYSGMQVAQFARNTTPLSELPGFVTAASTAPSVITRGTLIDAYLQEYEVRQFRLDIGSGRAAHLRAYFGEACPVGEITAVRIRDYRSHEDRPAPRQPQSIERHLRSIECSELWCSGGGYLPARSSPADCAKVLRGKDSSNTRITWPFVAICRRRFKMF